MQVYVGGVVIGNISIIEQRDTGNALPASQNIVSLPYRQGFDYFFAYLNFEQYEDIYCGLDEAVNHFIAESKNGTCRSR